MTVKDLETLYAYGHWANVALLKVASRLSSPQFTQTVAGGHGSVRNTLVHVLSAEWGWLSRSGGPARGAALEPGNYPTVESVAQEWSRVYEYVRGFLATLKDEDLLREVEFLNAQGEKRSMAVGQMLQHAATHAVHHRGQVALMLRLLRRVPGNFDLLLYFAEQRGVPAW